MLYEMCKKAMISKNYKELDEAIKQKLPPYLYNGGEGEWIHCAHIACIRNSIRAASKQFPFVRELPDPTTFRYAGSEILAKLTEGHSPETHPTSTPSTAGTWRTGAVWGRLYSMSASYR